METTAYTHYEELGDARQWADENIPLFDCDNDDLTRAYFYRWALFWRHLSHSRSDGWTLSEFLPRVNWAGPHNTINCPYGLHAAEGRWLRTPAVMDNYSTFWFRNRAADLRYTWWPAFAALLRFRLSGQLEPLRALYADLQAEYWRVVGRSMVSPSAATEGATAVSRGMAPPAARECIWQACHDDGQENSIGLDGCRPTANAGMFAEARSLAAISRLLGNASAEAAFARQAARWQQAVESLWSPPLSFFVTRTLPPPPGRMEDVRRRRTKLGCLMCPRRRGGQACPPSWREGELVDVRELSEARQIRTHTDHRRRHGR